MQQSGTCALSKVTATGLLVFIVVHVGERSVDEINFVEGSHKMLGIDACLDRDIESILGLQ